MLDFAPSTLADVLDRTGILLPSAAFALIVLAIIYHDRALFAPARRPGVFYPGNALPLLGHTLQVLRMGTKDELDTTLGASHAHAHANAILCIFVADGEVWKHARKTASHIFSAGQFRNWVQTVVHDELDKVVSILDQTTASKGSNKDPQGVIVLPELFFRYTLNSFSRMAFGTDIGCLTHDVSCLSTPVPFAVAFDYAQLVINERILMPGFQFFEIFSSQGKKMKQAISTIRTFAGQIIDQRLQAAREAKRQNALNPQSAPTHEGGSISQLAKKDGKDLLDLFMETTDDREELLITVLNFLIAGRDTTAQLLSWFFYEMMANPEYVDGIRRELTEVLGDCPPEGYRLPYERMRDLPYTFACITEALRLHPSVPKNGKQCTKDTLLVPASPNPHNLPPLQVFKGEMIGWSDWVMARIPEVWGPDCEQYNPARFLDTDSTTGARVFRQYSQWQSHMFNDFEALSIVAAILPLYDVHWASAEQGQTSSWPPAYLSSVTHPMEPYKVEFRRRQQ
ncbi:hypothetical protein OC846_004231 [Tilletia horrida]|uniref:Cytochrome P450 n=1 Tax=Tilletia horrida TaxID=155126 RepID=A0AAN6JR12_9BASI|nr:hypothetical protein OC846_004231 [Tilletia horrida]